MGMAKCLLALPGTPLSTQLTGVSSEMVSGLCYTEFLLPPPVIPVVHHYTASSCASATS